MRTDLIFIRLYFFCFSLPSCISISLDFSSYLLLTNLSSLSLLNDEILFISVFIVSSGDLNLLVVLVKLLLPRVH